MSLCVKSRGLIAVCQLCSVVGVVKRNVFPTSNEMSLWRMRRASLLSAEYKAGSRRARGRLSQRHRGYLSLSVGMPWQQRLELANAARKRNQEARKLEQAKASALRPYLESTRDL